MNDPLQHGKRRELFDRFGKKKRERERQHKKEKRQVDGNDDKKT